MTLAVFTTIYPQAVPYLAKFTASLAAQSDSDFLLYVANDGVVDAEHHFSAFGSRVRIIPANGTIAETRQLGLRRLAADGQTLVVFADSDDFFSRERVAVSRAALRRHDLVVNELIPFGHKILPEQQTGMLRPLIEPGTTITWREVLDHNFFGLSNTAARVAAVLPHAEHIAANINVFDWALFTRGLFHGASATFTDQAVTFYRQHGNNIAVMQQRDAAALAQAVAIKARHYADLASLDPVFAQRARFFTHLTTDSTAFARYAATIAAQTPVTGLWWSAARFFKESDHAAL